jgi:hypothetical protein
MVPVVTMTSTLLELGFGRRTVSSREVDHTEHGPTAGQIAILAPIATLAEGNESRSSPTEASAAARPGDPWTFVVSRRVGKGSCASRVDVDEFIVGR